MPSTFQNEFAAEVADLFAEFGEAATHYTETGTQTPCTVIRRPFAGAVDDIERADFWVQVTEVATLARGHYFVMSGETLQWKMVDVKERQDHAIRAHCQSLIERL